MPLGVDEDVLMDRVEVPEPEMDGGAKDGKVPLGNPVTLRLTAPLNPAEPVTVTLKEARLPALTLAEPGETDSEKSELACDWTVSAIVVEWVKTPLTPVTVIV